MTSRYQEISTGAMEVPIGITQNIRSVARKLYLDFASCWAPKWQRGSVRCVYCHFVFQDQTRLFEEIILNLKSIGKFISSDELLEHIQNGSSDGDIKFHLSFDDGLKNNFRYALPILEKHNIPATFFVPTHYIGASFEKAKEYCHTRTFYPSVLELMTSDDLKILSELGYTIGSHSHTHLKLSQTNITSELEEEILHSKVILEDLLSKECQNFSWPYGSRSAINNDAIDLIQKAGYKLCFGGFRGNVDRSTHPLKIPRHHFEPNWPIRHVNYFVSGSSE